MSDKMRGAIAILVGVFALIYSYVLYEKQVRDWHFWMVVVAALLLILIGTWRLRRAPYEDKKLR
jgi:hypothetical membrane protein